MTQKALQRLVKDRVDLITTLRNGLRLRLKGKLIAIIDNDNETHLIQSEMGMHEITAKAVARYGR